MDIRLQYPATPEHAADHAAQAVSAVLSVEGKQLDFSPGSLTFLDAIIEDLRVEGISVEDMATTLFLFGCYLGEVLVRNAGGHWVETNDKLAALDDWPMFIEMPWGTFCNPIRKPYKRLENGSEDSLAYFYTVFSQPKKERRRV